MPHDPEQKRLAGQKGRKHGVDAFQARGEAAMTPEQRQTLREIEADLETSEGLITHLRKRVAMGLVIVSVIETYAKDQVNDGATPDQIPILKAWPAFQNSTIRALKQLMDTLPKAERDSYSEALQRINRVIDEQIELGQEAPSDAVDAQVPAPTAPTDDQPAPRTQPGDVVGQEVNGE